MSTTPKYQLKKKKINQKHKPIDKIKLTDVYIPVKKDFKYVIRASNETERLKSLFMVGVEKQTDSIVLSKNDFETLIRDAIDKGLYFGEQKHNMKPDVASEDYNNFINLS